VVSTIVAEMKIEVILTPAELPALATCDLQAPLSAA
jgi:hypothetical protein